jgi:hypothetical protein
VRGRNDSSFEEVDCDMMTRNKMLKDWLREIWFLIYLCRVNQVFSSPLFPTRTLR